MTEGIAPTVSCVVESRERVLRVQTYMKTLSRRRDRDQIIERLRHLKPNMLPRWGQMTAPQMVCHLTDAFRNLLRERPVRSKVGAPSFIGKTLIKWVALYTPLRWPRGMKTRPEADQLIGGTPPSSRFADDVASLEGATGRFLLAVQEGRLREHYLFGLLSQAQWNRWAYRHMDHHLRQFGL